MSPEVASALRLLYGDQVTVRSEFLGQIDPVGLKNAFRKRAMELHPDRAKILGKSSDELSERFKDVQTAYEQLKRLLNNSPEKVTEPRERRRSARRPGSGWGGTQESHYWRAEIPRTRLLLGQYLYYAGLVTFNEMISAITWQRQQRPNFGKIVRMWNYLSTNQLETIIASRGPRETIGNAAVRLGYLSPFQRDAVIGFQKWLQRPIGGYFQKIGILEEEEIVYLTGLLKKHNARVERMKFLW
jgi:hypothetical protein